ncbi:MAG: hypothetical protein JNK61_05985 [Bacteroidia bacterium]|nr:hypothetical protein [Bacteroidia bacterium]
MNKHLKELYQQKPLFVILAVAAFFRLLAVIFSKGFGMMDDHFLIIEVAQSWVDGLDQNHWLPKAGNESPTPSGHSFFYTGIHYYLLSFLKWIGFEHAQSKMYAIRFLHAALSLIVVYCGYKIAFIKSSLTVAKTVGWLLALYWFMPFLSVRNLVEVVCAIPLIGASYIVIKNQNQLKTAHYLLAGFLLGIAFCTRFQTLLFAGGFGLALWAMGRFKGMCWVAFGFLLTAGSIQGITDWVIWHAPFVEFTEYVRYNISAANDYIVGPWYVYTLLLAGILIPPISIFLFWGFGYTFKRNLLLCLPSLIFLLFHSYFPNKQERFILPIVPFIITAGVIGWQQWIEQSLFWQSRTKLLRICWIFFIVIGIAPLLVVTVSYSKKNRVEAMTYLSTQNVNALIIEDSNRDDFLVPPLFYLGKWVTVYGITKLCDANCAKAKTDTTVIKPNFIIFMQPVNLQARINAVKKTYPNLTYVTTIEPSLIDKILFWLNPKNKNQTSYIYSL